MWKSDNLKLKYFPQSQRENEEYEMGKPKKLQSQLGRAVIKSRFGAPRQANGEFASVLVKKRSD